MQVHLVSYTPNARELLLFTKNTRLQANPKGMEEVMSWPEEKKQEELEYMLGTIQSSWEFVTYTFQINEVSRAFTHQFVRTRNGSYAQQSQRAVEMKDFGYYTPRGIHDSDEAMQSWVGCMVRINDSYTKLVDEDLAPQDARGLLPTNVLTNITSQFSLRTLSDMAKVRLCVRTQGEYQDVFKLMRNEVLKVHPWAEKFIRVACAASGTCAFPNFEKCPIKGAVFNPETGYRYDMAKLGDTEVDGVLEDVPKRPATKDEIQKAWEDMGTREFRPDKRFEAGEKGVPVNDPRLNS